MSLCEGMPKAMAASPSRGCQLRKPRCFHAAAGHAMESDCRTVFTVFTHSANLDSAFADHLNEPHVLAHASVSRPCCAMQRPSMTHSQTVQPAVVHLVPHLSVYSSRQAPRRGAAGPPEITPLVVCRTLQCTRQACRARRRLLRSRCSVSEPQRRSSTSALWQGWPPVPWDGWCVCADAAAHRVMLPSRARIINAPSLRRAMLTTAYLPCACRVTAKVMTQLLAVNLSLGFGSVPICAKLSGATVADFGVNQQVTCWWHHGPAQEVLL